MQIPDDWKYAGGVLAFVTILSILSKSSQTTFDGTNVTTKKHIKNLVRQSEHWQNVALQNSNPVMQLLHISKALSYAKIARKLASEREVNKIAKADVNELIYDLEIAESNALAKLTQKYPELGVGSSTALTSGWI
jgi:hypothetical protein